MRCGSTDRQGHGLRRSRQGTDGSKFSWRCNHDVALTAAHCVEYCPEIVADQWQDRPRPCSEGAGDARQWQLHDGNLGVEVIGCATTTRARRKSTFYRFFHCKIGVERCCRCGGGRCWLVAQTARVFWLCGLVDLEVQARSLSLSLSPGSWSERCSSVPSPPLAAHFKFASPGPHLASSRLAPRITNNYCSAAVAVD